MRTRSWALAAIAVLAALMRPLAGAEATAAVYRHITHLGWVVRDAEATAAAWRRLGVSDIGPARQERIDLEVNGAPAPMRITRIAAQLGTLRVDWIQPLDASGPYRAFLERHGEGVHHLGVAVLDAPAFDTELAAFGAAGAGVTARGASTPSSASPNSARFAWLDTATPGGLTLELEQGAAVAAPGSTNEEPFNRVTQFAFVVRDVAAVSRHLARFGFAGLVIEPNVSLDRRYRGAPAGFEMLLGWNRTGEVPFEWIQSTRGPNVYEEYLAAHGEGFHHLGLDVPDMDAALARLTARGLAVTMSGAWNVRGYEGRFAYLDTERTGGVTIELLWNKPRSATHAD